MGRNAGRGTIERRGDRWRARYVAPDGSRPSRTFGRKAEATAWLTAEMHKIDAGQWRPAITEQAETVDAYTRQWIEQRRTKRGTKLAPKTRADYTRTCEVALAPLAHLNVADLTPAIIKRWHRQRLNKGATQAAKEARMFRAVLNTAVEEGLLDRNPVTMEMTKTKTGVSYRQPTREELAVMVEAMPGRYRLALYCAAYGGMRWSEIRALRRRHVTFDETARVYFVRVDEQAQYVQGEGWRHGPLKGAAGDEHAHRRVVPMPSHLNDAIREHLDAYTGRFANSLLFTATSGEQFVSDRTFNRYWHVARDAASAPDVRFHDLRGFAASEYHEAGATLPETMRLLGHTTVDAAMRYQKARDRGLDLAARLSPLPSARIENVAELKREELA